MKINGISYWVKDGKCEMLNLDDGLKTLCIPAFMDKVNGEVIGLCGSVEKFIVEEGNSNYYVKNNCLISKDGELVAGEADSVIPTDGSIKRIGNMAFLHKAPMHLVIPDGVKSIGYRAFAESENLLTVYIPESVEEISYPFERCDELVSVFFDGSREQWEGVVKRQRLNLFGYEPNVYYKTNGIESRHLCPICGKMMFHTYNSHEHCDGCNWVDEAWYETHPDEKGVRGYTFNEYKQRYNKWREENPNRTFITDWDDLFWWDEEDDGV